MNVDLGLGNHHLLIGLGGGSHWPFSQTQNPDSRTTTSQRTPGRDYMFGGLRPDHSLIILKMKPSQAVHFLLDPVTGVSRPPNDDEHSAISHLDRHLSLCNLCYSRVRRSDIHHLCCGGELRVKEVLRLLRGGGDGKVYSCHLPAVHFVRVEIPAWFANVARMIGLTYRRLPKIAQREESGRLFYHVRRTRRNIMKQSTFTIRTKPSWSLA